jgi:hypothetical protein
MLADWVAATGTTGTGTWTLTAASTYANFNEPFGTSGTWCVWYEADDAAGNYESGYGTLTLGTGNTSTLTRTPRETRTSNGTYTRGTGCSALNFSPAPTVRISGLANRLLPSVGPLYNDANWAPINQMDAQFPTTNALAANTIYRTLINWKLGVPVSAIGLYIEGGNAAGNIRFGIYRPTAAGDAGALMVDSGSLSTASTGNIGITTAVNLPLGQYYMDVNCSIATVTLAHQTISDNPTPIWGTAYYENATRIWTKTTTYGAPADPAPANSGFAAQPPNTWRQFAIYAKA